MAQGSVKQENQRGQSALVGLSNYRGPLLMKQVNPRLTNREEPGGPDASGEAMQRATPCPGKTAG